MRQNPDIILKVWVLTGLISCPIKLVFAPTSPPLTGKVVNLLFLFNPDDVNGTGHYACIKTINRMLAHVGCDTGKRGKALCPFCNEVYENRREYEACPRCHIPVPQDDAEFDEDLPVPEVFVCEKCLTKFPDQEELEYHSNKCAITDKNYRCLKLPKERRHLGDKCGSGMKELERLHT